MANSEQDPLVEAIRDVIYTAVGVGLLLLERARTAQRDITEQIPEDLRDSWAQLTEQLPEDVRHVLGDSAGGLPASLLKVLSDFVDQAPAIADALREFVLRHDKR